MKKINRIRKISKERSKAKTQLKELKKTRQGSLENQQTLDIIDNSIVSLNVMKTKLGVDLLSEFVSKPIAEKILSKSVKEINAYNRMVQRRQERQRQERVDSTMESNKASGSNKGSGIGTPKKEKPKKKRGSSSDNKLVMA